MIDHFSSPTPLTTLTVSEYRVKHMCIAFIHRSRRETRPSPRFGHGCEVGAEANFFVTHSPPQMSTWASPPIPHTDGVRTTHTTGPNTRDGENIIGRSRPVDQGGSHQFVGLASHARRRRHDPPLCDARPLTMAPAKKGARERARRRDELFSSFVRRGWTRARASEARERHIERSREREGFATDDPIATQTTR